MSDLFFIVDTRSSIGMEKKGGSIALHKIAYELAKRGYRVRIFNPPLYPHENIIVTPTEKIEHDGGWWSQYTWEGFTYPLNSTFSVYPQIAPGNPFNTIHNIRWILHDFQEDLWGTYQKSDYIFNYGTFKVPEGTIQRRLTTFAYNFDNFYNLNLPDRKGIGHILHKKTPEWGIDFLNKMGSSEILHFNGKKDIDYLLLEFNKYEYIFTFDDKSYYTTAAALCGAKSIILNEDPILSPEEYRSQNPIQKYGVSYGMNDIKWANDTINLVRPHLTSLEREDSKTIDSFIEFCKDRAFSN